MPAQIDDPTLLDRILRTFRIKGRIAPFEISETAVPVFDIGNLTGLDPTVVTTLADSQGVRVGLASVPSAINTTVPRYADTDIVNSGPTVNPGAGAVIADTGQLTSGTTQQFHWILAHSAALAVDFAVEWRNAANTATLATWAYLLIAGGQTEAMFQPFTLSIALNERLRIITPAAVVGTVNCTIGAQEVIPSLAN